VGAPGFAAPEAKHARRRKREQDRKELLNFMEGVGKGGYEAG
jgi:hypothetical protein